MRITPPTAAARLALALMLILLMSCAQPGEAERPGTVPVRMAGQMFHLEVAATAEARFRGLSDRQSIPADGGMIFVFSEAGPRVFVMRRCLVPIDLIYLSPGGRIVGLYQMSVEPPDTPEEELKRYESPWPAQYAIEVAGGTIGKLGLREGEKIDLPLDQLKAAAADPDVSP